MQTFLPVPSFRESAAILDQRRLGKQRVEGMQIVNILNTPGYQGAWRNHPAVLMWQGYEHALQLYVNSMIEEWLQRGFRNSMAIYDLHNETIIFPWWWGDSRFHSSHKSNLLRKDFTYYRQFHWDVPPDLPYFWPIRHVP